MLLLTPSQYRLKNTQLAFSKSLDSTYTKFYNQLAKKLRIFNKEYLPTFNISTDLLKGEDIILNIFQILKTYNKTKKDVLKQMENLKLGYPLVLSSEKDVSIKESKIIYFLLNILNIISEIYDLILFSDTLTNNKIKSTFNGINITKIQENNIFAKKIYLVHVKNSITSPYFQVNGVNPVIDYTLSVNTHKEPLVFVYLLNGKALK